MRDGDGAPVVDYAGTIAVTTSDGNARVDGAASVERSLVPADRGRTTVEVAFSQDGAQTITVGDGTPWRTATLDLDVETDESIVRESDARTLEGSGPSFDVTTSASQINAGVPLTITVTALDAMGIPDTGYTGTVKFSSTDSTFAPGTTYQYTFTGGDAGVRAFDVTFNTADAAQTITVYDKDAPSMAGTSPAVQVDETYLHVSFASGTAVQNTAINMTVEAKDDQGQLVTGYRGAVGLTSTWDGVKYYEWGTGVTGFNPPRYTFTAGDAGSHTFTPKFIYAGDQTATITDLAQSTRTVTSGTLIVTNMPASFANRFSVYYTHWASPAGVDLESRVTVWASLASRGRLYVKRNLGTMRYPAWEPGVVVQAEAWDYLGADSPSLALMPDGTVALFYSYTDGTYYQIWMTTSDDDGASWSTPVQVTSEDGHVGRIQTVVDDDTLYLFWSRRDTNRTLSYQTTTDLDNWSSVQTVNQEIGVPVGNTTTNFGITKLEFSDDWVLGWLWTSAVNEIGGVANNLSYPTVHVARSSGLSTWVDETELNLPWSQRWPESVAIAQEPGFNAPLYAVYEHHKAPWDTYVYARASNDRGETWNSETLVGYDLSAAPDGKQGYKAKLPSVFYVDDVFFPYMGCTMAARAAGTSYPNGVTGTLDYDDANRLTAIAYADGMTALETISYVLDAMGMRTSMTDSTGTTDYSYDALYRLVEVEYPNSDLVAYGYDAVGNRTSLTLNGGTPIANSYNAANELTASGSDSYDANGNLSSKTVASVTTSYTWDALNRLTGLSDGMTTASYAYNGDWFRVAQTVDSVTTDYTWDQTGMGYVIADGDEYVRGLGLISRITSGDVPTYAHADGLGSVRLLTDDSGSVVGAETYDAFGASRSQTGTQLPFTFTGEQVDGESGLVYLRARYMDPATGRFISRDSVSGRASSPETQHRYSYVGNNPTTWTDPLGLCGWKDPWNCPDDVVERLWDFANPPGLTALLQTADMVPLAELCALTGTPQVIATCMIAEIVIGPLLSSQPKSRSSRVRAVGK